MGLLLLVCGSGFASLPHTHTHTLFYSGSFMANRFYSFRVVTYNSLDCVQSFCSFTSHYAFAFHDQDKDEDGSPRSPHFHILCTFTGNKSFDAVRKLMGGEQNTFVQPMVDKFSDFLYLTHKNAPDKFQYSDDIIVTNSLDFFRSSAEKSISNEEFLNDILPSSMLTYRQLAIKYGRDYIKNFRVYSDFGYRIINQDEDISRGYRLCNELLSYNEFLLDLRNSLLCWYSEHLPIDISSLFFSDNQLKIVSDRFIKNH